METFLVPILVACLLTITVFFALAFVTVGAVRLFVVVSPSYPVLPYALALGLALFFSLPVCISLISSTPLNLLSWGHAGELLVLPFILVSPFAYFGALSWLKRRTVIGAQ